MTVCRGIRGATTAEDNTKEEIFAVTQELFSKLIEANQIVHTCPYTGEY